MATASTMVLRYCVLDETGRQFQPPESAKTFKIKVDGRETGESRSNVRFVMPETWGFRSELNGQPWRGLRPWKSAEIPERAAWSRRKRFRLAARRREES